MEKHWSEKDIKLIWKDTHQEDIDLYTSFVIDDIKRNFSDMDNPSGLIFHHVFVTEQGSDGPYVFVYGDETYPESFICVYEPNPEEWVKKED